MFDPSKRLALKFGLAAASMMGLPSVVFSQKPWLTLTDLAQRTVTLTKKPETFVVANYIANFLFVGIDRIVGITADGWESTRYAEYIRFTEAFPMLKKIPSIGGYHDDILNTERILAIKPDVLLLGVTQYAQNAQRLHLLEKAGIAVIVLDYHAMTLQNHVKSTQILGQLLDRKKDPSLSRGNELPSLANRKYSIQDQRNPGLC